MSPRFFSFSAIALLSLVVCFSVNAQVGIGTTSPDSSSLLQIGDGTDSGGLLIPRVQLTAANVSLPVVNPTHSLLIYNTATNLTPLSYINDVRPGFYSWDSTQSRWITQTKETRTARWKSTDITETLNDYTAEQVNIFGSEIFNDDPGLFVVTPSLMEDELLITETGRYEIRAVVGFEVGDADRTDEMVLKCVTRLSKSGTDIYPSAAVYGYINDDTNILRDAIQINDIIEIEANTILSFLVTREADEGIVTMDEVGSAILCIRKME